MKEILERIVQSLNKLGQGHFRYYEQIASSPSPALYGKQIHIRLRIVREEDQKVLFLQSYVCDPVLEDEKIQVDRVRERLLSEILKHAVFGVKGVIDL